MKLTIPRAELLAVARKCQRAIGGRQSLPCLNSLLLVAKSGVLTVTGSNLDIFITSAMAASLDEAGAILVPAQKLTNILKGLSNPEVQLESNDKYRLSIKCGVSSYTINGLDSEEYAQLPELKEKPFTMDQAALANLIRKTLFAASENYNPAGILFVIEKGQLEMVGSDGKRMAASTTEVKSQDCKFMLPIKSVAELKALLTEGAVSVAVGENKIAFSVFDESGFVTSLTASQIQGSLPGYKNRIPSKATETVLVPRLELIEALCRSTEVTSETHYGVTLSLTRNQLTITGNTPEVGDCREVIALNYKGQDFSFVVPPRQLAECAKVVDSDDIEIDWVADKSPIAIRDGSSVQVIMPMLMK